MKLIYVFDPYCSWSYGFQSVIKAIKEKYKENIHCEILCGGMILPENPTPISVLSPTMIQLAKEVEEQTLARFGKDYLWHIENPNLSDWFPNSELPSIAIQVVKFMNYDKAFDFALDAQYGLFEEGRDLTDPEAYRHLLEKYELDSELFYTYLSDTKFKDKAHDEFNIVKRLQVSTFPATLLQITIDKFYLMANGYLNFEQLDQRFQHIIAEINN